MKKLLSLVTVAAFMLTMFIGCTPSPASSSAGGSSTPSSSAQPSSIQASTAQPSVAQPANLSGTIHTNGSTSMEKVIAGLIEAFTAEHPDVTISYEPTGSGGGITAAGDGTTDIGLSSRALKDTETGLDATIIALDGIAIIVNNANPLTDLSIEQIAGLFTGEIANWNGVGGADAPVAVIGREAGSGTRDGFESIVGVAEKCAYDQELTSTGSVITAVASNEYAIGYASLSAVGSDTKTLLVEGIECTEDTVLNGAYAVQRPFVFVTASGKELSAQVKAFIEYTLSDAAGDVIKNAGAVQAP